MKKIIQTMGFAILVLIAAMVLGTLLVQVLRDVAAPPPLPIGLTR